jgi:hypothetical protein
MNGQTFKIGDRAVVNKGAHPRYIGQRVKIVAVSRSHSEIPTPFYLQCELHDGGYIWADPSHLDKASNIASTAILAGAWVAAIAILAWVTMLLAGTVRL